jgi:hypothetical protein
MLLKYATNVGLQDYFRNEGTKNWYWQGEPEQRRRDPSLNVLLLNILDSENTCRRILGYMIKFPLHIFLVRCHSRISHKPLSASVTGLRGLSISRLPSGL